MKIREELADARARTLELVLDLDDAQWMGPRLDLVNPMRWEIGHLAWFQELWTLRRGRTAASLLTAADALYDSAKVAHDTRWDLPLPNRIATLEYMSAVLERSLEAVDERGATDTYFHRLATFHEDMHGEALTYTRQTLSYAEPCFAGAASETERATVAGGALPGDVDVPGARYQLGATQREPFVFDNEKWAHPVDVEAFRIARAPVTNEEYLGFVESSGYETRAHWTDDGQRRTSDQRTTRRRNDHHVVGHWPRPR